VLRDFNAPPLTHDIQHSPFVKSTQTTCTFANVNTFLYACMHVYLYVCMCIEISETGGNASERLLKTHTHAHTHTHKHIHEKDARSRSRCCALARSFDQSRERVFSPATVSLSISRTHSPSFTHMYNYTRMGAAWR